MSLHEWSIKSKGQLIVYRQHWYGFQDAISEVPETVLRDATHLQTLLEATHGSGHDGLGIGHCILVTWTQQMPALPGYCEFMQGVSGASVISNIGSLA